MYKISKQISIHALLAESDQARQLLGILSITISIHALLAESDKLYINRTTKAVIFLSTLSLRRATPTLHNILELFPISIHALLAESDVKIMNALSGLKNFYPRSPCGERLNAHLYYHSRGLFLSTLSLRRATVGRLINHIKTYHFYPRSPCGERL